MNKDKISFLIYLDYEEQFDLLTDEQIGQLMRAIMKYEKTREVPELDGMLKMAFSFIKTQLDRDREKYKNKCEKNKENGAKGGRPKATEVNQNKKANGFEETERLKQKPKKAEEDKEEEIDKEKDNDNNNNDVVNDSCVDDLQKVIEFYNENIGMITPYGLEVFEDYSKEMTAEVIIYAMQISVEADKRNIRYIKAILNNWVRKGIKTLIDAKKENKDFKFQEDSKIEYKEMTMTEEEYFKNGGGKRYV